MAQGKSYEIEISKSALHRYQEEVLPYLIHNFSLQRALEIEADIENTVQSLALFPSRGTKEKYLQNEKEEFRFVLHRETSNFELKIIYFIQEKGLKVYVTDFFPTRINPVRIRH
ncbi:hypothetical protein SAMN04489724_1905 [Algoriphagus locisalis]|uniref:ParE toxin of type II toxin-antitoxin system, parDE n=1 Tax=Algoriphagus locisalis TaxID=305507 RepID=A0A1I7AEX2_9BACT|nr:hypothetical protein [Algoriphagus locisalis]SFT73380.1 hypothetical protein SAMN04489724_1905 [Algoriphagus locisalis]